MSLHRSNNSFKDRCDGLRYYHAVCGSGRLTQALVPGERFPWH